MRTRTLSAALLVAAACFVPEARALNVGDVAPDFSLTDQHGKAVKLSDFAGKTVVLEWFNEGCPFVKKQYVNGSMNAVAKKYADKGVIWLAVNSTSAATVASNADAAKDWKMDRPVLDDHDGKVGHAYGATNTPDMYVVGPDGKVAYRGAIDSKPTADPDDVSGATNYVAQALDEILAGKTVSLAKTKPYGCTVKYAKS